MLLYKQKKNHGAKGGKKLLVSINVLGSAGPIRFVVGEDDLVAAVIDTALKSYAREGRLPVLGSDTNHFSLYCPNAGSDALSSWETIGSLGARSFMLCKKPESVKESASPEAISRISRKGGGSWKAWLNKSLNLKEMLCFMCIISVLCESASSRTEPIPVVSGKSSPDSEDTPNMHGNAMNLTVLKPPLQSMTSLSSEGTVSGVPFPISHPPTGPDKQKVTFHRRNRRPTSYAAALSESPSSPAQSAEAMWEVCKSMGGRAIGSEKAIVERFRVIEAENNT